MPNQIQKIIEEFREKYDNDEFYNPLVEYESPAKIQYWLKQTFISLLSQEIQELEELKWETNHIPFANYEDIEKCTCKDCKHNRTLTDLITKKKQLISDLNNN